MVRDLRVTKMTLALLLAPHHHGPQVATLGMPAPNNRPDSHGELWLQSMIPDFIKIHRRPGSS
jgi:hypothetical protein